MTTIRLEVQSLSANGKMNNIAKEARNYLGVNLDSLEHVRFYHIESKDLTVNKLKESLKDVSEDIFFDPIIDRIFFEDHHYEFEGKSASHVIQISYRAGVTDNTGKAASEALGLVNLDCTVSSGQLYFLFGEISDDEAKKVAEELLGNDLIQKIDIINANRFYESTRFTNPEIAKVKLDSEKKVELISLDISDDRLLELSKERCLALTLSEMQFLKETFKEKEITDVELEVIAQTWSEHCKHKIFASNIEYSEHNLKDGSKKLGNKTVNSLYKTFIKNSTENIKNKRNLPWLISVFEDNAGIVRFDKDIDLCIKAETHNSPSALDPYGGALTGILGVNRDILGCGLGARPIANTDVFCFADPSWPNKGQEELMPAGLMQPRRIFEGVHKGVEDGGNKSGIPTVNGSIYFDQDYAGKPLVFCGTVGVLPQKLEDGRDSAIKTPMAKDRIYMVGGAIGADGIHGATFSSLELDENAPATAVQIGDPLTQKRVSDFLFEARDMGLYTCITDNGAGGLSSSVGEMALLTNGASIDLKTCPVKYPGLSPYELMISESQERMTIGVPLEYVDSFEDLAKRRGVEASNIGEFTNSSNLEVFYGDEQVLNLSLEFLHDGLPKMELKAVWDGERERTTWIPEPSKKNIPSKINKEFFDQTLGELLQRPNICSKESWVRQYDHEVQGATHIKPFGGVTGRGPNNSGVIWLKPHGGSDYNAISIGCGMAPRISLKDPYLMAQYAVDEAIRNVVVTGGNLDECCLLDNFCWPDPIKTQKNPDGDYKLAQLVRTCQGLSEICEEYGTPLVSGKDSMKNDFRGKNNLGEPLVISILPTLLVTAMASADIRHTVTSDFKQTGDLIYLLGKKSYGLNHSEFSEIYNLKTNEEKTLPEIDLKSNKDLYQLYQSALANDLINSGHDLSEGGLAVALAESCFGNKLGCRINGDGYSLFDDQVDKLNFLFNESPGRFLVSIPKSKKEDFEKHFENIESYFLGSVQQTPQMEVFIGNELIIKNDIPDLFKQWTREL